MIRRIVAFSDTEIGVVTHIENGILTIQDTIGAIHNIHYKSLGYGRKRKMAILSHLYGKKCLRCGSTENLSLDHISGSRRSSRGGSGLENLQILCRKCNIAKDKAYIDYRPFHPQTLFKKED